MHNHRACAAYKPRGIRIQGEIVLYDERTGGAIALVVVGSREGVYAERKASDDGV
jgi:hypothetical protein